MRPIPPRVVIIPPSSSSTVSSASSGFSTSSETRPLIQRNARLRAHFFDQQQNDGKKEIGRQQRQNRSLERTTEIDGTEIRPRVCSCRIPPPPIPPHYSLIPTTGQNENDEKSEEGRPWWRPPMESSSRKSKLAANGSNWWTRLKAHFQDKEKEYGSERSIGQAQVLQKEQPLQKVVEPGEEKEDEEEEKPRKRQSSKRGDSWKKAVPACFLYTANRKKNKENRMEQGPREYVSCKDILIDFCARTSSHGIPFVGTHSFFGRPFWATVTAIAFCSFIIQTYFTLSDYVEYRTIIEMQLKFEPAPFPAATICNLNAFKLSEVRKFEEIEQGIQLWERAISTLDRFKETPTRRRRQAVYRPVLARCVCTNADDQCVPQQNKLDKNPSVCLCYEDQDTGDIWPCYLHAVWKQKKCPHCSNSNTCDDPDKPPNITTTPSPIRNRVINDEQSTVEGPVACLCQPISHYCLRDTRQPGQDFDWWNPHNYSIYPSTTHPPPSDVEEAFGLEDLKDRGAITTKTKENLIFLVAGMSREIRQSLSYKLHEFVLRCSFNSKDCDLNRDFQIQIDPEYGNCWTFNFNDSVELKNSRAGPMYGLRLLLNVNQSDYMPTTEAAGVRIVVHEQDQEPFPDTFGYSAPTGFVSSFGLKTKILHRLDSPYGKCSDTFRPAGYIYAEHYSPEGCYRNCFQHIILERCACGDPRFPLPNESEDRPCDARNPKERACLTNQTAVLGGFHHLTHDCHCVQPCTEHTFETAYSASAWPAQNFNIGKDDCALVLGKNFTMEECTEYYRKNTALIEIYYEQLNYEKLKETPGYTLVNLFSDLGGNIGLWIGFSLITVLEIVELIFECLTFGCKLCVYRPLQRKAQLRNKRRHDDDIEDENLDGKTEFRHGGSGHSQISRRSCHSSEMGQQGSDGPAFDGHKYQYQRRWARAGSGGPKRSWTTRLPIRHTTNMQPSIEEKQQMEESNGIASAGPILDQYTYTYTFGNPFDSPKNGIAAHQNNQMPNTVQFASPISTKK